MGLLTFKRGIHPSDEKHHTENKAIEVILPKVGAKMTYPMVQHLGMPCQPCVSIGERVLLGQKIGDADGYVTSPIHSSVSGTVVAIEPTLTPVGVTVNSVIIENDGKYEEHESVGTTRDYTKCTNEELIKIVREAGVVGLGGAGFPTHVKLVPPKDASIDTILINCAECEPYLTTDYRVMLEETDKIIEGVKIMLKIFPDAKAILAVESNKPKAVEALKKAAQGVARISVVTLQTKYPQGSEKQLIQACTGKQVQVGKLPASSGVLVNNVDTIIAIHRAIVRGRPLMRKVITLSGGAIKNPGNYKVRLGMSLAELIEQTGGLNCEPQRIIVGGPMMGISTFTLNIPMMKTTGGVLCFNEKESAIPEERDCIRCGKCVEHCPIGLMPFVLNQNVIFDEQDDFVKNHGMECIECGSCSYICPAKRYLAQSIRKTRRRLLSQKKK